MKKGDNIRLRADGRYEARYVKGRDKEGKIRYGYCYGKTYEEALKKREWQLSKFEINGPKLMNLLIIGAGSHGKEVAEVANGLRIFNKISFLDDNISGMNIIGKCEFFEQYLSEYTIAIPGVGNDELRKKWIIELSDIGYIIPTLIDSTAVISRNTKIGYGTVVCARAVLNTGSSVGNGCIISSGAVIATNAHMNDWTLINSGETLLETGEIK